MIIFDSYQDQKCFDKYKYGHINLKCIDYRIESENTLLPITAEGSGWVGGIKVGWVGLRCATDTGWYWVFIINTASPREVHLLWFYLVIPPRGPELEWE